MDPTRSAVLPALEQNRISEAVEREKLRLGRFIEKRVADAADAEDILQEVFYELVEADRLMKPIEQVTAWMFQVARNRITDLFRSRKARAVSTDFSADALGNDELGLRDLLPAPDAGPEAAFARSVLLEEIEDAIEELPLEQREVLVAHELEGRSFQEMAAESSVSINTLLSRKRYAILHLRRRLQSIYEEFGKEG